jgi:hypothetical protein
MDFIHFIIVFALVTADDGTQHHTVISATKRGFTSYAACEESLATTPSGSRTPAGDPIIASGCIGPAVAPGGRTTPPPPQLQLPHPPDHHTRSRF